MQSIMRNIVVKAFAEDFGGPTKSLPLITFHFSLGMDAGMRLA